MAADPKAAPQNLKPVAGAVAPGASTKPKLQPLKRGDARLYEFSNNVWSVEVPAGTNFQELNFHSTFWNYLADDVRRGDDINAQAEDGAVALFKVVDAGGGRVVAGLAFAVDGAPRLSVTGPRPIPEGFRIERTKPSEADGYIAIRERDNVRFDDSGMPWKNYQAAYEGLLKNPIFQSENATRYLP